VIDERQVRGILSDLVKTRRQAMADPFATWIEALTAARLGLRSPAAIEQDFGGDVKGFAEVFPRYRAILDERNLVDFDEQIVRAIEILLTEPAARRAARRACRLMLVDEFQDLAPAHLLLVRLVAGPAADVFGVGDDDQTIYGYAGASPDWLIDFDRYFPGAGTHDLQVNYRCPPAVVAAADTLLTHNRRRVAKTIHGAPGRDDDPSALTLRSHGQPLDQLIDHLRDRIDTGVRPGDLAVLTRVNATLLGPMIGLHGAGIPATRPLEPSFLDRTGVASALAWMRLATGPAKRLSSEALAAAARRPPRGLSYRMVEWIAEKQSIGELEAMANRMRDERDQGKIRDLAADLARMRQLVDDGATTADVLNAIREDIGLGTALEQRLDASRRSVDRSAHGDDLTSLATLADHQPDPAAFPSWLATQLDQATHDPHGIQLATVHRVKGREWPEVVVFEATAGLFPHRLASDREEERRVFHVALTRGRDRVTVLSGEPASPFVAQLTTAADPDALPEPELVRPARAGAASGKPKTKREVPPTDSLLEARLREQLKEWRRTRSKDDGVPAYVVFADTTLYELARLRPSDRAALLGVPGIGPAKADRYGDELIELLSQS
jgi:DNA helicase-2/ATP-dependent DNA helicase PcrA